MDQNKKMRDEILAMAETEEERKRLRQTWDELGSIADVDTPVDVTSRIERALAEAVRPTHRPATRWARAAVFFGVGLLTGVFFSRYAGISPGSDSTANTIPPRTAIAAAQPHRSAAERLAAIHILGACAGDDSTVRTALISRALHDPTPGVQLAAIDYLAYADLSDAEIHRMAAALPELGAPIVQIALLDLLIPNADASVLDSIVRISRDRSIEDLVRRYAGAAVENTHKRTIS